MDNVSDSLWTIGALLVLATLAMTLIRMVKRWRKESDLPPPSGFTIGELRKIYQDGQISKDEFEKASAKILAAHTAHFLRPAKTNPMPGEPPSPPPPPPPPEVSNDNPSGKA